MLLRATPPASLLRRVNPPPPPPPLPPAVVAPLALLGDAPAAACACAEGRRPPGGGEPEGAALAERAASLPVTLVRLLLPVLMGAGARRSCRRSRRRVPGWLRVQAGVSRMAG